MKIQVEFNLTDSGKADETNKVDIESTTLEGPKTCAEQMLFSAINLGIKQGVENGLTVVGYPKP